LYLKEHIISERLHISPFILLMPTLLLVFLAGCASLDSRELNASGQTDRLPVLENSLNVPGHIFKTDRIKTVEFFKGARGSLPVITLGSNDRLTFRFDEITEEPGIFRLKLTHHNADWSESQVIPAFFQAGQSEDTITNGTPSVIGDPSFVSYEYHFPNRHFGVRISGNYLLHLLDYHSGKTLVSLPFIVKEDRGALRASIEEVFDFRATLFHQIFATYTYPDFIQMPQTDLSFHFIQNQNWGRYVRATEIDASAEGRVRKHQRRDQSFNARYEFRPLIMDDFNRPSRDVLEIFPEKRPPRIRLQYDVVDLDINPRISRSFRFGLPETGRSARYVDVEFNLQRPDWIETDSEIYVTGPFTNWQIQSEFKMAYIPDEDAFSGGGLIKEGRYNYVYVVVENNRVDDLRLQAFFADNRQFYQVIVYYHDMQLGYDRVLQFLNMSNR